MKNLKKAAEATGYTILGKYVTRQQVHEAN